MKILFRNQNRKKKEKLYVTNVNVERKCLPKYVGDKKKEGGLR